MKKIDSDIPIILQTTEKKVQYIEDKFGVKVIDKDTNKPTVIIHPKSIMGLMLLNISDRKAHIVVSTV